MLNEKMSRPTGENAAIGGDGVAEAVRLRKKISGCCPPSAALMADGSWLMAINGIYFLRPLFFPFYINVLY